MDQLINAIMKEFGKALLYRSEERSQRVREGIREALKQFASKVEA